MPDYALALPMLAGREAFLTRAGMVSPTAFVIQKRWGASEGQNGAKFSRWENFASSRSAGMGKASAVKYVT